MPPLSEVTRSQSIAPGQPLLPAAASLRYTRLLFFRRQALSTQASHVMSSTPTRGVKFESALDFLDQVKLQFQHQPQIYNYFLDVMKEFKAQTIDTPGVIARVSDLFKGHDDLILGFNTFLPPGYKIVPVAAMPPPSESDVARKQPEFDHARAYVKKIKMRFLHQPQIYKNFLEILHTFHREQHTIKDVYEQVAYLFQDHPDLLEEFSEFLPENTTPNPQLGGVAYPQAAPIHHPPKRTAPKIRGQPMKTAVRDTGKKAAKEKAKPEKSRGMKRKAHEKAEERMSKKQHQDNLKELNFFYKVRKKLNNDKLYNEFLKCLNLFSNKIITRVELAVVVRDVFAGEPELFERFKKFIGFTSDDELELPAVDSEEEMPSQHWSLADIDFSACKRYGPSYRALPKNYQKATVTGDELSREVLNTKYVSMAMGSEEGGFKGSRKNQYEEVLFKYELDLVIELNSSTMRALEPILKQIMDMPEDEASRFKIDNLDVLHIRSIERIYGNKGPDVVDKLFNNPVVAVPVILKRLKQKDNEWRNARREWNKIWREAEKKNLSSKVLLAEIKQKYQEKLKHKPSEQPNYHLKYGMNDPQVLNDINDLITNAAERILSKADRERLDAFMERFIKAFFLVPSKEEALVQPTASAMEEEKKEGEVVPPEVKPEPKEGDTMEVEGGAPPAAPAQPAGDAMELEKASEGAEKTAEQQPEEKKMDEELPKQQEPEQEAEEKKDEATETSAAAAAKEPAVKEEVMRDASAVAPAVVRPEPMEPQTARGRSPSTKIFFGNKAFYCFFRLYQIIYDRLTAAKEMEKNSDKKKWAASVLTPPKEMLSTASDSEKKDPYQHLITSIYALMEGSLEQSKFEDDCRDMFGISSYILFTIDKLIVQLAKQLQILITDDSCAKLLALYAYEGSRPRGSLEVIYHSNVLELLPEDDRCFRFEFSQESCELTIQLLDSTDKPRFVDLSFDKDKWAEYVENYVQSDKSHLDVRKHKVFLLRNQRKWTKKGGNPMENVVVSNGLECKICLTTYRLFYVQDTHDFFYRRIA
ncbi:paired amphipathic helix protein sin3, putative [Acanthamoeba castellanii str. Neff]|uniref:Paired amphipathic helix protein sin3, putative n=1 Tax=Acanthamoeba castellanii (strain ATCC 30010 / Neff) TaxID=1257118 RepID=L8GHK5_ACACF|nr:paired amphipathic helix protein sin3, putative [Acanthamoeba castellanii str. Neff]ELR12555.1 paired amphipathic helix protein sin3, putative [Acanthamoeba castellanii str. Neff]